LIAIQLCTFRATPFLYIAISAMPRFCEAIEYNKGGFIGCKVTVVKDADPSGSVLECGMV